ncbi:hypothetical protein U9M48_018137 [Paspalum notatum var. saurae]|uniref:Uncharacterized protein n=1 Tax=Paspalum notatum var. saurae TaxID=547442 RepID=A0AAQ3TC50_PASNO
MPTLNLCHESSSTDAYARHRDEALAESNADMPPTTIKHPRCTGAGTRRQPFYPRRAVASG